MKFLAAEIRSFARFTRPVSIQLDAQGLILVEGRNYDNGDAFDSNGAGKSMLFEAIKWCLFGKMSRYGDARIGADEVTYEGHPADVSVLFETNRGAFHVQRQRRSVGSPSLHITTMDNGSWVPLRGSGVHAGEATESAARLLGFDYQTLRYALTLEGTSLDIASAGFSAQMKILESILRFDVYTEAQKIANTRAKDIQRDIDRTLEEMARQQTILQQAQATLEELESLDESAREAELTESVDALTRALKDRKSTDARYKRQQAASAMADEHEREKSYELGHARSHVQTARALGTDAPCPTCRQRVTKAIYIKLTESAGDACAVAQLAHEQALEESSSARERLRALESEQKELDSKMRQLEQDKRELADLLSRKEKRLSVIAAQTRRAESAESELARLTDSVASTRRDLQHADFWSRRGFSDLKQATLAAATPVLNEAASRYSQTLSDGAIQVVFDTFRESRSDDLIRASGETAPTYQGMSNGEKRRTQIIAALSLRALARWRMAESINFAVWDEVFDPLDESGVSRAMQVLQQDMDELSSVFVITHSPVLKSLFPGARILRVIRENGESRIE